MDPAAPPLLAADPAEVAGDGGGDSSTFREGATQVPLALLTGGKESLLPCPGGCGNAFTASRLAFHLRGRQCAHAAGDGAAAAAAAAAGVPGPDAGALACPAPGCSHASPNLKALRKHYAARHGGAKHACGACGARFGRSDLLSRHSKQCQQPGHLACVCAPGSTFKTLFNLNRHIRARAAAAPEERHARCEAAVAGAAAAAAAAEEDGGAAGGADGALPEDGRAGKGRRRRSNGSDDSGAAPSRR